MVRLRKTISQGAGGNNGGADADRGRETAVGGAGFIDSRSGDDEDEDRSNQAG